ncbi:MAG: MarR family transcriptional regulator [Oceanospirillaceae bacterium]|nr:MarR family transcriptional regulator [Oceanospirillaceae bacterium]
MDNTNPVSAAFRLAHALKRSVLHRIDCESMPLSPMHVRVLKTIEYNAACTANDIAIELDRDKAQVTRLVNTLVELGIVGRQRNPSDKRSQILLILDKGKNLLLRIEAIDHGILQQLGDRVSADELVIFAKIASKMADSLEKTAVKS